MTTTSIEYAHLQCGTCDHNYDAELDLDCNPFSLWKSDCPFCGTKVIFWPREASKSPSGSRLVPAVSAIKP